MDDILASIRRILHSDAEAPPTGPAAHDEIIDLDSSMQVSHDESAAHFPEAGHAEPALDHPGVDPWSAQPASPAAVPAAQGEEHALPEYPVHHVAEAGDPLLSADAAAESGASLAALRDALAAREQQQSTPPSSGQLYRGGGVTIEDIVRDEVRVLLRAWLDDNLPPLVERLVRAEIARIADPG